MVHLIIGLKGEGKTRELLDKVNTEIKNANGNIVYLDINSKHMYELNNRIRLIDVSRFPLKNSDEFVGFISGIISQDHDLQTVYLDAFRKCARLEDADVTETVLRLDKISTMFNVEIVISLTEDITQISDELKDKVLVAL